jgi:excisionase family DNA binding protein
MNEMVRPASHKNRSRKAAAEYIGVCVLTIDRALKAGEIDHYRIGRRVLFSEAHLNTFLLKHEKNARVR